MATDWYCDVSDWEEREILHAFNTLRPEVPDWGDSDVSWDSLGLLMSNGVLYRVTEHAMASQREFEAGVILSSDELREILEL